MASHMHGQTHGAESTVSGTHQIQDCTKPKVVVQFIRRLDQLPPNILHKQLSGVVMSFSDSLFSGLLPTIIVVFMIWVNSLQTRQPYS